MLMPLLVMLSFCFRHASCGSAFIFTVPCTRVRRADYRGYSSSCATLRPNANERPQFAHCLKNIKLHVLFAHFTQDAQTHDVTIGSRVVNGAFAEHMHYDIATAWHILCRNVCYSLDASDRIPKTKTIMISHLALLAFSELGRCEGTTAARARLYIVHIYTSSLVVSCIMHVRSP